MSPPAGLSDPVGLPAQWDVEGSGCLTVASFFLVNETRTHPYLPPGFFAGDLSEFLYNTPVTSAKVPAFVAASTCQHFNVTELESQTQANGALELVYVGFFIRAPEFSSAYANRPSDYNFYAVSFLTPLASGTDATRVPSDMVGAYGWNQSEAQVTVSVTNHTGPAPSSHPLVSALTRGTYAPDQVEYLGGHGTVTQGGQQTFTFEADAFFPQAFAEEPRLRFWQAAPAGIGFMEFELPQRTVMAGPLRECAMLPGTLIHDIAADRQDASTGTPADEAVCGLLDSFALVFDEHALAGRFHHLDGVFPT